MEENNLFNSEEKKEENKVAETNQEKKIKNLISICILLGGLFAGSLFVDFVQLIKGQGFSSKRLSTTGVLESSGKTWVAYDQPVIKVKVFSSDDCTNCKTDEVLVWLRRVVPTISAEKVDATSAEGKKLSNKFGIKTIPGFLFGKEVEKTDFFAKAPTVFQENNGSYVLNGTELGIPVGEYLELPKIEDQDPKVGQDDAKVKLIEFSDFQCPYCKALHDSIKKVVGETGDQIELIFKSFPLDFHPQAGNAALAAACANEQGKFWDYSNKLFASQSDWSSTTGTQKFKTYAVQMGMNASQFNKCLDDKKYQDLIDKDKAEGTTFGISGTPALFINNQFKNGALGYDELKTIIQGELTK